MLKQLAKTALQLPVALAGPHRWRSRRSSLVVFTYHRVVPRDDTRYAMEQPGMLVTPGTFASHLKWMKRHFNPVSLSEWIDGKVRGAGRPACAVTFDDGWRDNHEFALPLLRSEGMRATAFLVSDYIGTDREFWPGRLQRLLSRGLPPEGEAGGAWKWIQDAIRKSGIEGDPRAIGCHDLIEKLKQYSDSAIETQLDQLELDLSGGLRATEPTLLDWHQVREMISDGTVEAGSHGSRHRRLGSALDDGELEREVVASARTIEQNCGQRPRLFCYPNGDRTKESESMVRRTYEGACLVYRGWNRLGEDPYRIKRISMHEDVSSTYVAFLSRSSAVV